MSPSTLETDVATVGPEAVDDPGDLAPKVVKEQQAHELIASVRANYPLDLVILEQREEESGRSKALEGDEVLEAAREAFGDEEAPGGVVKLLSARVRGKAQPLEEKAVCVLWETPSGRTARGAIGYSNLDVSMENFDRLIASGEITEVDDSDAKDLKRTVERQQEQIRRLNAQVASGEHGDPAAAAGLTREDVEQMVKEAVGSSAQEAIAARDDEIERLKAELAEKDASGDGSGDDAGNGAAEADAGGGSDAGGDASPKPVTAPEGKAKELIAAMGDYSPDQLAAIVADDNRPSVVKAAEAEQKRRAAASGD